MKDESTQRCHNCNSRVDIFAETWDSTCPNCGNIAWLAPGDVVDSCVTKLTEFGAFVDIGDRVKGLIHISELADFVPDSTGEILFVGDTVRAIVLRIDMHERRIGLSVRRLTNR